MSHPQSLEETFRAALGHLCAFLRFPSISTQADHREDMRSCAMWVDALLRDSGLESRIEETGGHPCVLAKSPRDPSKRTVLIYGHYDVQPPDPLDEWETPPFEPVVRDGRIFARGSTDNKGQILAHILGVAETLRERGALPVNVIFLIEGEEEIGSPSLPGALERLKEELAADVAVVSDTGLVADAYPTLTYALRGIMALEFRVLGPVRDLHSGFFGGAVANPLDAAARLLASLHDAEGRVAVAGFYDAVRPVADWEKKASAALPVSDEDIRALAGVDVLTGEPGYSAMDRIGARPTVDVNGFGGGYQGEGTKTVLPKEAFVKLTCRLVPNQAPREIQRLVSEHLKERCPPGVRLEILPGHHGDPFFMDPDSPFGRAARRALVRAFGREPALLREGGSIPIVADFQKILGIETLLLGLASPDNQAHSPNENFPLANLEWGIRLNKAALEEIARESAD